MGTMQLLFGFLCILSYVMANENSTITIGIVANGNNTFETERFSMNGHHFVLIKHHVDTTEIYDIYSSVKRLDVDPSVDIILVKAYDMDILKMSHMIEARNKKLIKLGATSSNNEDNSLMTSNDEMTTHSCNTNFESDYCLTTINSTRQYGDDALTSMPEILAVHSMVKSLKWRSVTIFYESSTEWQMSTIVDGLSKEGVLTTIYNADHVTNFQAIIEKLYRLHVEVQKEIKVITVCRFNNTEIILKAANSFDVLNEQKTLLKMFSRWLIVMYDNYLSASRIIQQHASVLDNIALVDIPRPQHIGMDMLYEGIETTSLEVYREGISSEGLKENLINRLEKDAKKWNPSSCCRGYNIYTLYWRERNSRELSSVGHFDLNGNVVLRSEIFPNVKYIYNKRRFLATTLEITLNSERGEFRLVKLQRTNLFPSVPLNPSSWLTYAPFAMKRKVNNTIIFEGLCIDLMDELANKLNFTYDITEPEDGQWGAINRENHTFNGMVGQIQRDEVDIIAAPLVIQADRDPVMDFSFPWFYEYTTILVKKPDVATTKWRTLVDPLKFEVLLVIGASLILVTVLIYLMEKNNPFYLEPKNSDKRAKNNDLKTWLGSFWIVFGALVYQGSVRQPRSSAGRILLSCWWLMVIIIVGTYCGNLVAFLTVTKEKPPFNSLEEMVKLKGTYTWGTIGGTAWQNIFPHSRNKIFREMGEAFVEFNKTDPTVLHGKPEVHVQKVKNEKYAWIGDITYIDIALATECDLMTIKEQFMPLIYVFGFMKNSPHSAIFSEQMIKIIESGLLEIWQRNWMPKYSNCVVESKTVAKPISLMDVQSAFYVCVIGASVGLLAFVIEMIAHKYRSQ